MYTRPDELSDTAIQLAVRSGWGVEAVQASYRAAGFGSHHWVATDRQGRRLFLTIDDLAFKAFLGLDAAAAFDGLGTAFSVARMLHERGLDWVVGPLADRQGQDVRWLDERFSIAAFPYVHGTVSSEYASAAERIAVVALLTELHGVPKSNRPSARAETFQLPNRNDLDAALGALDQAWNAGPYAERARVLLRRHAPAVVRSLTRYDQLAAAALQDTSTWTLTHGEPHSSNVMRTSDGLRVIDWDTLRLGPPERDLWMLAGSVDDPVARSYTERTGHRVDPQLLELYALWWDLCEVGIYSGEFRSSHADTEDIRVAWQGLLESTESLQSRK